MTEEQRLRKRARTRAWKAENKEAIRKFNKEYHATNKHRLKYKTDEATRIRRQEKSKVLRRVARESNNNTAKRIREYDVQRNKNAKLDAISTYGGKCASCGETEPEFLTLDHVNDDGCTHRKKEPFSRNIWRWAKANDFPKALQLLCMSCNTAKTRTATATRAKLRKEVFEKYGGKCKCCGEEDILKLVLDHVDGGGCEHRREAGYGGGLVRWAKKNGFPDILRCLCSNCNLSAHFGNGVCIHQRLGTSFSRNL
jgi:hypothetical protein